MRTIDHERQRNFGGSRLFYYQEGERISHRALYDAIRTDGFALIRNAPIDNCTTDDERRTASLQFLSRFPFLGIPLKQNSTGEKASIVRDAGVKIIYDRSNRPILYGNKGSQSHDSLGFHNDAAPQWHGQRIGTVALVAFKQAPEGGETTLVNAEEAFEIFHEEDPITAGILTDTRFYFDRSSGYDQGQLPYSYGPIIRLYPFRVRYTPRIYQGFETAEREISSQQRSALAKWDEVLGREELHIKFTLRPKDILFLNENVMLHARSSYKDDPQDPRTLVRVWKVASSISII